MTAVEIPTPDPRTFDDASRPFAEAIAAQYAVKKMIGRGGMGIVYLARDRRLDRLVAVKTLPPQLAADSAVRERFIREMRAAGGMSHPNIVPIHGADEVDGHVFFVMGYVDGESLATHVAAHGRLEPRMVGEVLRDVANALSHAHRRGIIHRDIKAENILIDRATGRALVTDFGIARFAEAAPLTATGQLLGTVYYVSPEQVAGESVDQRSDLYSLGVVGYFALTGRFPFEAELASAVLVAHVTRPAPPVRATNPEVPAALADVIDRCLAKDRSARFASADELLAALEASARDAGRASGTPQRVPLISDTEAHTVWQRAAELQTMTGVRTRPDLIVQPRDIERDRARTSGFSITDVRSAATQAGISGTYVERALAERGLVSHGSPAQGAQKRALPRSATRRSLWAGAPLDIVADREIDGETDPRRFDRFVNTLREGTATLGTTDTQGRALTWRGEWFGHRLEAKVSPESGRTSVRLVQSMHRGALAMMGASLVGGAAVGAAAGVALSVVMSLPAPRWSSVLMPDVINSIAGVLGAVITVPSVRIGRALVRRMREYNAARLETLAELLALRAGDGDRES